MHIAPELSEVESGGHITDPFLQTGRPLTRATGILQKRTPAIEFLHTGMRPFGRSLFSVCPEIKRDEFYTVQFPNTNPLRDATTQADTCSRTDNRTTSMPHMPCRHYDKGDAGPGVNINYDCSSAAGIYGRLPVLNSKSWRLTCGKHARQRD